MLQIKDQNCPAKCWPIQMSCFPSLKTSAGLGKTTEYVAEKTPEEIYIYIFLRN